MKKNPLMLVCAMLFCSSCSDSSYLLNNEEELASLTQQYEQAKKNANVTGDDEDGPKIETTAEVSVIKKSMKDYVTTLMNQVSVAKEKVMRSAYNTSSDVVAVFKAGSCGTYKELWLKMDCEDRRTTSYTSGKVGDTYVDGDGNVNFYFCLTEADRFYPGGVLLVKHITYHVPGTQTSPDRIYVRRHDTEDSDSYNDFSTNHSEFGTFDKLSTGYTRISRDDLILAWDFPRRYIDTPIGPSYINYGLLVPENAASGTIFCDDEDKNNANWVQTYDGYTLRDDSGQEYIVEGGMTVNDNTTYSVCLSSETNRF